MLAMSRRTYTWLTTSLMGLSAILVFGSILALQTDWLQRADFLVQFAVFPGGLIAGGVVFLINGCVEHYADSCRRNIGHVEAPALSGKPFTTQNRCVLSNRS